MRLSTAAFVAMSACALVACASIPEDEADKARATIDQHERESLEKLYLTDPDAKTKIEGAVGHAVFQVKGVFAVMVVGEEGKGVLIDHSSGKRIYMYMVRAGTGPGLGAERIAEIIAFKTRAAFDQFSLGGKVGVDIGVTATAGTQTFEQSLDPMVTYWHVDERGGAVQAYWGGTTYVIDPKLNKGGP